VDVPARPAAMTKGNRGRQQLVAARILPMAARLAVTV